MSENENKNKKRSSKPIRIVLLCFFGAVFVVSGIMLVTTLLDYGRASDIYAKVQDDFAKAIGKTNGDVSADTTANNVWTRDTTPADTTPADIGDVGSETTAPITDPTIPPEDEYDSGNDDSSGVPENEFVEPVYSEKFLNIRNFILDMQKTNPEIIGYIYIEFDPSDTSKNISYPLVRGTDNVYYMTHSHDGSQLKAGAIFLDHRNFINLENNYTTIIYGHNMNNTNNGNMFHNLKYFKQEQYFYNTLINVYTLEGIYTYKPFAVFNTESDGDYTRMSFKSYDELADFFTAQQKESLLSSNMTLLPTDKFITLSTCLNTLVQARLAVQGVLVNIER